MSNKISLEDRNILRKFVPQAEQQGYLTKEQLAILYEYNLFNLFVPKEFNGLELDFIEALEVEEELATIDGSLGWTVTLCSGANMFVGYLDSSFSQTLFSNPKVCLAGSGKVGGVAIEIEEGYIVTGHWKVATGLHHSTGFTANCRIERNGTFVTDADGNPIYKSFCFLPEEIEVVKEWDTIGLISTGSDSFNVKGVRVGRERAFSIAKETKVINNDVFSFPFLPFAKFTLAVNHIGMQAHFIELAENYFDSLSNKEYIIKHKSIIENMKSSFLNRKIMFYQKAHESWEVVKEGGDISCKMSEEIDKVCERIVFKGREDVMNCLPYLGLDVINKNSEINRVFRDLIAAGQHSLFL
ncbi:MULTISPECIES: acyl-CoA dehydrogenase family protein [Myroides]|uniref:Hydroxylase n=1 Tax=Myroides albus TaxID=2562892 RepID=A0A6I3LHJ4_9FLAO|nr:MULTISPECIES: acyl-CoA dehydrogenase family protein [Myroides]MTG97307.1 hydroxylase [Myroides albus]MVX35849.1 hydroxylase [Myroides sp. LoEW2-1]UVD80606.1 acyl-CoA dehydrogenase family protein [Myroides albus]